MAQLSMFNQARTAKDVVFTHDEVAADIIGYFQPSGIVLDPCKGEGSFYNQFPANVTRLYCEIAEGKDFFNFSQKVNWIIGNPPYSIFLDFLKHSFKVADDVVYLIPTNKVFQSWKLMKEIQKYGGIRSMLVYGSGHLVGFPFGFSVGAFHFRKGYTGEVALQFRTPPNNRLQPTWGTDAAKEFLSQPEGLPAFGSSRNPPPSG